MPTTMAKKKPTKGAGEPADRGQDRHKNVMVGLRPPPDVLAVLEACAREERRSKSQMALILVEEALQARGRYERPDATD